jgi:hypothetical protein
MALVCCILGKFLGVVCHCFPLRLDVPTFATRCPHVCHNARDPQRRKVELWARILSGNFAKMRTSMTFRDLLHAANLRHRTDGFTSPPNEGVLRIFFSPLKNQQLQPGLNLRTWVLKASTLPLDHRSRLQRYTPSYNQLLKTGFTIAIIHSLHSYQSSCVYDKH